MNPQMILLIQELAINAIMMVKRLRASHAEIKTLEQLAAEADARLTGTIGKIDAAIAKP